MAPSGSPRRQASQWQQQDVGACPCRTDSKAFVHRGELYLFGGEVRRGGQDQVRSMVPAILRQAGCSQLWLGLDKTGAACHADYAGYCHSCSTAWLHHLARLQAINRHIAATAHALGCHAPTLQQQGQHHSPVCTRLSALRRSC